MERERAGSSLIEVLDRVLDKGIVIDASVRVALVGVELLGVDARVVVASFETYLRHADELASVDLAARPVVVTPGITAIPLDSPTIELPPCPGPVPDAGPES